MKNGFALDFLCIGAPKCGTTWINQCLSEHPEICTSSQKELHFFSEKREWPAFWLTKEHDPGKYHRGETWYASYFAHCQEVQKQGEVGTLYLYDPGAANLIHDRFPNIKLFVVLREPSQRLFSQYTDVKAKNLYNLPPTFAEAVRTQPEFVDTGNYYKHLQPFLKLFPQEQMLILIYEDIKKDPQKFIQEIYTFLEVDNSFVPPSLTKNINPTGPEVLKTKLFTKLQKIRENALGKSLLIILRYTGMYALARSALLSIINNKRKYSEMSAAVKTQLHTVFKDDIKNLEALLGRKLREWR